MSGQEVVFLILGAVATIAALVVVASRNVVHGALMLAVSLGAVGATFMLLGAEFVGWTQILIYVGAVVVLLLFGLMLTKAPIGRVALDNQQRGVAFVVAAGTFAMLTWMIWSAFGDEEIALEGASRTAEIGRSIFSGFVLPFEAVSVLLLAALVGAIVLARRDDGGEQ